MTAGAEDLPWRVDDARNLRTFSTVAPLPKRELQWQPSFGQRRRTARGRQSRARAPGSPTRRFRAASPARTLRVRACQCRYACVHVIAGMRMYASGKHD